MVASQPVQLQTDKYTILSAMLKKGVKPQVISQPSLAQSQALKKAGPAENKLKAMMNRNVPTIAVTAAKETKKQSKIKSENSDIGEEINE